MTARLTSRLPASTGGTHEADDPAPGPWSPLTERAANALLSEGGYGLRVEWRGQFRLAGPGAGVGIPLGPAPTWGDLYEALVRLRRTRRRRDPAWLYRLTRTLTGSNTGEDGTGAIGVAEEVLTAGSEDLAWRCLDAVTEPGRRLPLPGPDRPVVVCVPERTVVLEHVDSRDRALRWLRGWERLASAVESDPLLRMHCATQQLPAAVVADDVTALLRVPEPSPAHPGHPGGTVVVPLAALRDGTPGLLDAVLGNRFERREDELGYFLDHFVRPLLRTFRIALDHHRIGLFSLDERGVGVELSPELRATGRIVVTGCDRVVDRPDRAEVDGGVSALLAGLDALTTAFVRTGRAERLVRDAVQRVVAEEMRYLAPSTAELLAGAQPLRSYAHSVPESQDTVLREVLSRVQAATRKRRREPDAPQPVVAIDLDMCGIVPHGRIRDAARAVAGPRPGAPDGIVELAHPDALPVLPSPVPAAWRAFVDLGGLGARYPGVDWEAVRVDFVRALQPRLRDDLSADGVNAGLARFVWDVRDAGGRAVFYTGRRERFRESTRAALAAAGVPDAALLCVPAEPRDRPGAAKAAALRGLGDVVAVFDDQPEVRAALTEEFPGALAVAVRAPGVAAARLDDTASAVATFETAPHPGPPGPRLSNTHSLEELQIGALRGNRPAQDWAVHLTEVETQSIVDSVVADVDRAAARTARAALAKFAPGGTADPEERRERTLRALHHVLTRKQFLKGSRSHYRFDDLRRDAEPFLRRGEPIDVVLLGFPVKQCLNRLKASGPLPDLAEFGGMARLREMHRAVSAVYEPGLRFNILTDGRHFRTRPPSITAVYRRRLREYAELAGIGGRTSVEEVDEVAVRRLGDGLPAERAERIDRYRRLLADALRPFDITDNPLRTLERVHDFTARVPEFHPNVIGLFREILMSLVYSVPVPAPSGAPRLEWSTVVYSDIYNVTDPTAPESVRRARAAVLRRAWDAVLRYMATMQVDEEFGYERMFPNRIRLTLSAVRQGCLGFTYLGGSGLLPWQGTGVVDPRGRVAVDFAVSLLDQGFVPVYSPLLGPRQPWFMVPADATHLDVPGGSPLPSPRSAERATGVRLDPDFASRIRLRRK